MANYRTTADIMDAALLAGGEVTTGNSPYEAQLLNYLDRVHRTIVCGGTIPVGKDSTVEIDEIWPWAKSRLPLILELEPKLNVGTVTLTLGSEAGTFSSAPAYSVQGWKLKISGRDEYFRISTHVAAGTAFEIDGAYPDASGAGLSFEAYKTDYDLIPDFITIDASNNSIQVQKVAGTTISGTLTNGVYSPGALITHVAAVATTALSGPTVTGAYDSLTRKFTLTSNLVGPTIFRIDGAGTLSEFSVHKTLGFDDVTSASAAAQTSTYALGGIARLIEPMKVHKYAGGTGSIFGIDSESFQRNYPINQLKEGVPERFCVLRETANGTLTVRFNSYPKEKTRIEIETIPIPRDLQDNTSSIPLVPRKHVDVLEDAAVFYMMLAKNDDKMAMYAQLLQGKLVAMVSQHRGTLQRGGENFGMIVPRLDDYQIRRRRLLISGGYT